jgi:hypothetical protein
MPVAAQDVTRAELRPHRLEVCAAEVHERGAGVDRDHAAVVAGELVDGEVRAEPHAATPPPRPAVAVHRGVRLPPDEGGPQHQRRFLRRALPLLRTRRQTGQPQLFLWPFGLGMAHLPRFLEERFAAPRFAVDRFVVERLAVLRFAVDRLAVLRLRVLRFFARSAWIVPQVRHWSRVVPTLTALPLLSTASSLSIVTLASSGAPQKSHSPATFLVFCSIRSLLRS